MFIEEVLDRKKFVKVIAYYKLTIEDSGFYYFGSTTSLFNRITQHRSGLNCGRHDNIKLSKAYLESTSKKIHVEYRMFPTIEEANAFEEWMISQNLNDPLMCNIGLNNKFGDVLTLHPNKDELIKIFNDNWEILIDTITQDMMDKNILNETLYKSFSEIYKKDRISVFMPRKHYSRRQSNAWPPENPATAATRRKA